MIRRPPRSTQSRSSAASDVYKRQLQGCLGPGVILKVLRCPTANGGGCVEDPLADLTHTEGDLASFERLDVTPGLKLVLRRFCQGLKVLARPDTTAELYVCL